MKKHALTGWRVCLLLLLSVAGSDWAQAQPTKAEKKAAKLQAVRELVASRHYTFLAQSATPLSGASRQLTSEYTLTIRTDTVDSYLPYFGRAYTVPIGSGDDGIKFTSTRFGYTMKEAKNGGWDIEIRPKDVPGIPVVNMYISESGYTTLRVTPTNRQMISFYGYIKK